MGEITGRAGELGRQAHTSGWLDTAVRIGLVAYGVVNLMVAWLAAQLALGDHSGSASSQGALHQLSKEPFGELLIWLIALGMFLLVGWRLLEAGLGHRESDGGERLRKRLVSAGKALVYGSIGVSAFHVATGSGSKSGRSTTARLMDLPFGRWLVGLVGLAIVGYGLNLVRRGWTEKFREHLDTEGQSGDTGRAYVLFGKAGYLAKGIAFVIVGGLFCYAASTHDPKKSGGLDQALRTVLQQPFGQLLLLVIAAGFACYSLFCFARARHLSR